MQRVQPSSMGNLGIGIPQIREDEHLKALDEKTFKLYFNLIRNRYCFKEIEFSNSVHYYAVWQNSLVAVIDDPEASYLSRFEMGSLQTFQRKKGWVHISNSANDFTCAIAYKDKIVVALKNGCLKLVDPRKPHTIDKTYQHHSEWKFIVSDPDYQRIIAADAQGKIIAWNVESEPVPSLTFEIEGPILGFSIDKGTLVALGKGDVIYVFDLPSGLKSELGMRRFKHPEGLCDATIYQDQILTSSNEEAIIRIWDVKTLGLKKAVDLSEIKLTNRDFNKADFKWSSCHWSRFFMGEILIFSQLCTLKGDPFSSRHHEQRSKLPPGNDVTDVIVVWDPIKEIGTLLDFCADKDDFFVHDGKLITGGAEDSGIIQVYKYA